MVRTLYKRFTSAFLFPAALLLLASASAFGQNTTYTEGNLSVDVFISNPCDGSDNGFITFTVNSSTGGSANLLLIDGAVD